MFYFNCIINYLIMCNCNSCDPCCSGLAAANFELELLESRSARFQDFAFPSTSRFDSLLASFAFFNNEPRRHSRCSCRCGRRFRR